jgi:MFS superfamily sulfate permease-like transporter
MDTFIFGVIVGLIVGLIIGCGLTIWLSLHYIDKFDGDVNKTWTEEDNYL